MDTQHPLEKAIAKLGLHRLARDLNLTHQALRKWQRRGRLPRTEWTGETNYAQQIAALCGNEVSVEELKSVWPAWPELATSEPIATTATPEPATAGG